MEEFELTDPAVVPERVTRRYRLVTLVLSLEAPVAGPSVEGHGLIRIEVLSDQQERRTFTYEGQQALDLIAALSVADLSERSLPRRVFEQLAADGLLVGTVVGTP